MSSEETEVLSTEQVRVLLNYKRVQDASKWCRDQGIEPLPWRSGSGERLWPGNQVRDLAANRPGQGTRRDLGYTSPQGVTKRGNQLDEVDRQVLGWLVSSAEGVARAGSPPVPESGVFHPNRLAGMERRGLVKRTRRQGVGVVARVTSKGRAVFVQAWADPKREV